MSISIIDKTFRIINAIFKKRHFDDDLNSLKYAFAGVCVVSAMHAVYSSIMKTATIKVARKYTMWNKSGTIFMIVDSVGNHYEIPVNVRHWQWNIQELYDSYQEGNEYEVTYFGKRIPVLASFPCLIGNPRLQS